MLIENLNILKNEGNKILFITGDLLNKITGNDLIKINKAGFIIKLKLIKGIPVMSIYLDAEYFYDSIKAI